MLVEVLDVLPLLLELLLDSEEPGYVLAGVFGGRLLASSSVFGGWSGCVGDADWFVLGLLFLADVELLGGRLALGEGITVVLLAPWCPFRSN